MVQKLSAILNMRQTCFVEVICSPWVKSVRKKMPYQKLPSNCFGCKQFPLVFHVCLQILANF